MLSKNGFNIFIKRTQRLMRELEIKYFSQKDCPYDNVCVDVFHAVLKKKKFIEIHMKIIKMLKKRF